MKNAGKIIDGKAISARVREGVAKEVGELGGARSPKLDVLLVGEDPASRSYVRAKAKACRECGIEAEVHEIREGVSQSELLERIGTLNRDPRVDGILVQLPLPGRLDEDAVILALDPAKDVDGLHPENLGLLAAGRPRFTPCTPTGIGILLEECGVEVSGKEVVILGRSLIVGKSMALLLSRKGRGGDATVTLCHSRTRDISSHTRRADIVVAALGSPAFLTADMVAEGAVVIDVGINRIEDSSAKKGYRLVGDVDFEGVAEKASRITPVPGGVGPMTVAVLMRNTLEAFKTTRARAA